MKRILTLLLCLTLLTPCLAEGRLTDEELQGFYRHSIFVGDSIPRMLWNYIKDVRKTQPEYFPDIKFYTSYNYQLYTARLKSASTKRVNLVYKGRELSLYEIVQILSPRRVFILAGVNDAVALNPERGLTYTEETVATLREADPGLDIYFFSLTPVTQKVENEHHYQAKWDAYNALLEEKCAELGVGYIDIATDLKDEETGLMKKGISSDGKYHLNASGNAIWAQTLLDWAQRQYEQGVWTPADNDIEPW